VAGAKILGQQIAEQAKGKDIARFVVDRGGFAFGGRIKAVVDGALEGGLTNTKEEK
jgi:large subunit ribosomal protein L18